jgi:hypothetical protein
MLAPENAGPFNSPQLVDRGHRRTGTEQDVIWAQQAIDLLLALPGTACRPSIRTAPFS